MTKMMMTGVTVAPAMKLKTVLMITTVKVQICCIKQKTEQNIRTEKTKVCEIQQEKGPRKLLLRAAYAFCTMAK